MCLCEWKISNLTCDAKAFLKKLVWLTCFDQIATETYGRPLNSWPSLRGAWAGECQGSTTLSGRRRGGSCDGIWRNITRPPFWEGCLQGLANTREGGGLPVYSPSGGVNTGGPLRRSWVLNHFILGLHGPLRCLALWCPLGCEGDLSQNFPILLSLGFTSVL